MKLSDIIEKAYISAGLHFNRESDNIFSIEYQDEEIVVIANEHIWALSVLVKIDKSDIDISHFDMVHLGYTDIEIIERKGNRYCCYACLPSRGTVSISAHGLLELFDYLIELKNILFKNQKE